MNLPGTPQHYWEDKLLQWERFRYSKWLFFYPLSWTARSRLSLAINTIKIRAQKDWSVLELGCGSGILATSISNYVGDYLGIDIASNAIALASKKNQNPKIQFMASDVLKTSFARKDIVIFLGLTDWLTTDQLRELFSKIRADNLLFSYTETKAVSAWSPYTYYRKVMDRESSKYHYKARTYSADEIRDFLKDFGYSLEIIKSASLVNPGAMVWAKKTHT